MLITNEFAAGDLRTARPIALLRAIAKHERDVLVAGTSDKAIAIILSSEYCYEWFEAAKGENWTGLIIPNLRVELDETSAFDARRERSPFGAAVRSGNELVVRVKDKHRASANITLEAGLPPVEDYAVGFRRWQLVLGYDATKRVIHTFDVTGS